MKRRLDLALALLHSPRILFLDEPTTGLDVQSRTSLWDEVARLAHEEGTTVFLTTQYLEEADVLADRVGIIDRGTIVAEGTPAQLKAQVAKPTVELVPRDAGGCARRERRARAVRRAGRRAPGRLDRRAADLRRRPARRHRARARPGDIAVANLALHEPTLDDVFLAKTGRSLEGAADAAEQEPAEPVAA